MTGFSQWHIWSFPGPNLHVKGGMLIMTLDYWDMFSLSRGCQYKWARLYWQIDFYLRRSHAGQWVIFGLLPVLLLLPAFCEQRHIEAQDIQEHRLLRSRNSNLMSEVTSEANSGLWGHKKFDETISLKNMLQVRRRIKPPNFWVLNTRSNHSPTPIQSGSPIWIQRSEVTSEAV